MSGCGGQQHKFNRREFIKASAGAAEFLNITREMSANNYVRAARDAGFTIVALDAKGTLDIRELQSMTIQRLLLVIGGEDKSVGQYNFVKI